MKTFKIGEPIRFGVRDDGSGWTSPDVNDFKCYYSTLLEPTKETEIEGEFLDDDPFYWTPIFYLFSAGTYVIHIVNDNDDINIKETFKIEGSLYEGDGSEIII